ncbi:MAG TPA: hypothetical protein VLH37_10000 [Bacteroidales bacterium]|nr:hypothetical protein [Bacteroidales bacterium]
MKMLFKSFLLLAAIGVFFASCDKNDNLAELGTPTGLIKPFNLLAQMQDAKVTDTLMLRTVSWSEHDDISTISFFYEGFRIQNFSVRMAFTVSGQTVRLSANHLTDTIFIERTLIESFPRAGESLNDFYQTIENAYVIICPFYVGSGFGMLTSTGALLIEQMSNPAFNAIVQKLSLQMNRAHVLSLFPGAPVLCFEFNPQTGAFTGNLTPFGFEFVRTNLTRARLAQHIDEATVEDNSRGTIESVAVIGKTNASTTSSRNFRIIK